MPKRPNSSIPEIDQENKDIKVEILVSLLKMDNPQTTVTRENYGELCY